MPAEMPEAVVILLWCAAVAAVVWVYLPMLLGALGVTRFTLAFREEPDSLQPPLDDPDYAAVYERLTRLGFEPLGWRTQRAWFFYHFWVRTFRSRVFALPGRDCFALVFRLAPDEPCRIALSTAFTDGAVVLSANQMEHLRIQEANFVRWGLATPDLGELLDRHRELVEDFRAARGRTVARLDLAGMYEVVRGHEERRHRQAGPKWALQILPRALCFVVLPPLLFGWRLGFAHWAVPAGLILGSLIYGAFWAHLRRWTLRRLVRHDESRRASYSSRR